MRASRASRSRGGRGRIRWLSVPGPWQWSAGAAGGADLARDWVQPRSSFGSVFRVPRTEPWNQRLTTVDNPHIILMTHGSGVFHSQSRTHCGWSHRRSKNKTTDDPVRRLHNAAPQRTTRKPQTILRSRARACYPGGLQLASKSPTHRNRILSATSMFITAAVSSCVGAPLAPCGALEDPFTSTLVCRALFDAVIPPEVSRPPCH